jgi:hypothetical protein
MKVENAVAVVEHTGVTENKSFGIKFDAKMANILASGLYSDKIKSIIRELSCNAFDSHTESKNDEPFEVHLPSTWEPWFHVKDFGTGLSHEQITDIYTTYGVSTKTDSNEYIGQLGLGSKSPFSYTDAFTVDSRFNGTEYHYAMHKDDSGMPSMALMGSNPTNEKNGITVKMPVKREDIYRFCEKAVEVFVWFSKKPKIIGANFTYPVEKEVLFSGDYWKILSKSDSYSGNKAYAIMGNVAYPLNINSIPHLTYALRQLLSFNISITFPIGDLEIAASREELGYDKRTISNITLKITNVFNELRTQFEEKFKSCKTLWEAKILYHKLFDRNDGHSLRNLFYNTDIIWKKVKLNNSSIHIDFTSIYDTNIEVKYLDISGVEKIKHYDNILFWQSSQKSLKICRNCFHAMELLPHSNPLIIFDDLPKFGLRRVNHYSKTKNKTPSRQIFVFGKSPKFTFDELKDLFGNPEVLFTSAMDEPPKLVKVTPPTEMLLWKETAPFAYGVAKTDDWIKEVKSDADIAAGGFYVRLDRYDVTKGEMVTVPATATEPAKTVEVRRAIRHFPKFYHGAVLAGIIPPNTKIYAGRRHISKKLIDHPKWIDFVDFVQNKSIEYISTNSKEILQAKSFRHFSESSNDFWSSNHWKLDVDSPFHEFIVGARTAQSILAVNKPKIDGILQISKIINLNFKELEDGYFDNKFNATYNKIIDRYPMIQYVNLKHFLGYNKVVNDYINLIDATANQQSEVA